MGIVTGSHTIINKNPQLSVCIESATLKLISGLNYLSRCDISLPIYK
jgi:hypothetical protein